MPNKGAAARKPQIHFEQVPVEIVKEIAEIDDADDKPSGLAGGAVDRPANKMAKSGQVPSRSPARKK